MCCRGLGLEGDAYVCWSSLGRVEREEVCGFAGYVVLVCGPACKGAEGAKDVEEGVAHFVM